MKRTKIKYENQLLLHKYIAFSTAEVDSEPHIHSSCELSVAESGSMEVTVGDRTVTVEENGGILVFPYSVHSYKALSPQSKRCTYNFTSDYIPDFQILFETSGVPFVAYTSSRRPEFTKFAQEYLVRYSHSYSVGPVVTKGLLTVLISGIMPSYTGKKFEESSSGDLDYEYSKRLLKYIHSHLCEDLSLDKLSKELNVVPNHISSAFSRKFGMTLNSYIVSQRMSLAESLLRTSMNITEIAFESGFSSIRNFNRAFRETFGMSPTEYRAKYFNVVKE